MVDLRIVEYIRTNIAAGFPVEQIRQKILASGVSEKDLNDAVNQASVKPAEEPAHPVQESFEEGEVKKSINKWVIIIPVIVLVIMWIIFGIFLLR